MKNLELRSSLIKSGVLIGLFIFFIYAFAVGDSGGIGGTIGSLFAAVTFIIGLCLALVVSVIVIFGIYFGILYLYDAKVCKTIFVELKEKLATVASQYSCDSCCSSKPKEITPVLTTDDIASLQTSQNELAAQLATTNSNLDSLQKTVSGLNAAINSANEELIALSEKADAMQEDLENKATSDAIADSTKKLGTNINSSIKPLSDKITSLEETVAAFATNDEEEVDDGVQEKIDKTVAGLQKELSAIKESIAKAGSNTVNAASTNESRHRILGYFSNKKDEKKFVTLVKEKVSPDMTYAQVDEFLVESLSKGAVAILADHPSLTKDYIRTHRQKD